MYFLVNHSVTGRTITVSMRQVSDVGVFGDWWNFVNDVWEAAPAGNEGKLTLAEDGTTAIYAGGEASVGGTPYTGNIVIIAEDEGGRLGVKEGYLKAGIPIFPEKAAADHEDDWDSGGVLRVALDLAAAGGAAQAVSVDTVGIGRRWTVPATSPLCPQILTVGADTETTFAVDFSRALNGNTGIASPDEIEDDLFLLDPDDILVSQDRQEVRFNITGGLVAGNSHKLNVFVNTTDGDKPVAQCRLRVV